jgi:hypothetical protein
MELPTALKMPSNNCDLPSVTTANQSPLRPQLTAAAFSTCAIELVDGFRRCGRSGFYALESPAEHHAKHVNAEGREVSVYTLTEIGRLLSAFPQVCRVKEFFPGAAIAVVRREIDDPLDDIVDTNQEI